MDKQQSDAAMEVGPERDAQLKVGSRAAGRQHPHPTYRRRISAMEVAAADASAARLCVPLPPDRPFLGLLCAGAAANAGPWPGC